MSATVSASLFSRQQLAAEIADPRLLTHRRAVSLAFRHYRRAESELRNVCAERSYCSHLDPEDCVREVYVADDQLEGAVAAYGHESVAFDMPTLMRLVRIHQDDALARVRRGEFWAILRTTLRRNPGDSHARQMVMACVARKRERMLSEVCA